MTDGKSQSVSVFYLEIPANKPVRVDEEGYFSLAVELVEVRFEDEPVEVELDVFGEEADVDRELPLYGRMERVDRLHRLEGAGLLRRPHLLLAAVPLGELAVAAEAVVDDGRALLDALGADLEALRAPRVSGPGDLSEPVPRRVDGRAYRDLVPRYAPEFLAVAEHRLRHVDRDKGLIEPHLAGKPRAGHETRGDVVYFHPPDVDRARREADHLADLLLEAVLERHRQQEPHLPVRQLARREAGPRPIVEIRVRAIRVPAFPLPAAVPPPPVFGYGLASAPRAPPRRLLVSEHKENSFGLEFGRQSPKGVARQSLHRLPREPRIIWLGCYKTASGVGRMPSVIL